MVVLVCAVTWPDAPARALVLRDPPTRTDAVLVFGGDPMEQAIRHVVPADKILMEEKSTSTRESVVFCLACLPAASVSLSVTIPSKEESAYLRI